MFRYNLYDIWRHRNREKAIFSRKQVRDGGLSQSRIDYFLVCKCVGSYIQNIYYNDTHFSDHSYVTMKIDCTDIEKGPGIWVLNNSFLLEEDYNSKIRYIITEAKACPLYENETSVWWDNLKYTIKKLF